MDHRHGVEEKFWLAQFEQANLYSDRAHEALDTVKVVRMIPSVPRCANKFSLVCLIREKKGWFEHGGGPQSNREEGNFKPMARKTDFLDTCTPIFRPDWGVARWVSMICSLPVPGANEHLRITGFKRNCSAPGRSEAEVGSHRMDEKNLKQRWGSGNSHRQICQDTYDILVK
ncbi:hypothetical protein EI94DRAFT_1787311 [Lactarius quietus]|nr:hypothetical protein EI94DRAFT_1787311 [Lactarius quietus]